MDTAFIYEGFCQHCARLKKFKNGMLLCTKNKVPRQIKVQNNVFIMAEEYLAENKQLISLGSTGHALEDKIFNSKFKTPDDCNYHLEILLMEQK